MYVGKHNGRANSEIRYCKKGIPYSQVLRLNAFVPRQTLDNPYKSWNEDKNWCERKYFRQETFQEMSLMICVMQCLDIK